MFQCKVIGKLADCVRRTSRPQEASTDIVPPKEANDFFNSSSELQIIYVWSQFLLESIVFCKEWSDVTREAALDAAWFICQIRMLSNQFNLFKSPWISSLIHGRVNIKWDGISPRFVTFLSTGLIVVHAWIREQVTGISLRRWTGEHVLKKFDSMCRLQDLLRLDDAIVNYLHFDRFTRLENN